MSSTRTQIFVYMNNTKLRYSSYSSCALFSLGDVSQALQHLQLLLQSRGAFFNDFIMEGLRFSSSLYMMLIWLRAFQWVLNNLNSAKEKLNPSLANFRSFFEDPSADTYIEEIIRHMTNNEQQRVAPTRSSGKRRLAELADSDDGGDDINLPGPSYLQQRQEIHSDISDENKQILK